MKSLHGQEIWINAFGDRFGERVCVGIEGEVDEKRTIER